MYDKIVIRDYPYRQPPPLAPGRATSRMTPSLACGAGRALRLDGNLSLRLHEWGAAAAAPTLLLHSLAAHAHWWDWVAPFLGAQGRHVVALDFRGHGGSGWMESGAYGFTDHVSDVVGVLDALGWGAADVIGHSLGGYVGALLAARHPARVRRLVIADMLTGWSTDMAARARRQAERRPPAPVASRAEAGARFKLAPPETRAPADRLTHLGEAGVVERRPGAWEPAFDRRVFLHPPVDPWPFLPDVAAPTLVIRGELSPVMDRTGGQRVAAALRHGRLTEVAGAFHHLIVDEPAEFARLVGEWLLLTSEVSAWF
jgi:pimeloyl-ACP methyl ester carboxylesterase